jgi:hypothetical protein
MQCKNKVGGQTLFKGVMFKMVTTLEKPCKCLTNVKVRLIN